MDAAYCSSEKVSDLHAEEKHLQKIQENLNIISLFLSIEIVTAENSANSNKIIISYTIKLIVKILQTMIPTCEQIESSIFILISSCHVQENLRFLYSGCVFAVKYRLSGNCRGD